MAVKCNYINKVFVNAQNSKTYKLKPFVRIIEHLDLNVCLLTLEAFLLKLASYS